MSDDTKNTTEPTDEMVQALLKEFKNDHDYDPEWDYLPDAIRYLRAALAVSSPAPTEDDREALIEWMHARQEFEYDSCDHGTYNGGPMHGQPYKMCERWADAFLRDRPVLARRSPVPPSEDDQIIRDALSQIHYQDARRTYSVAEVKQIVYPLVQALREEFEDPLDPKHYKGIS